VDYSQLNSNMVGAVFPLPIIEIMLQNRENFQFYSKFDLRSADHEIHLTPEMEKFTPFRLMYGTFAYKVILLGMTNAIVLISKGT
jgi:hypothetical protein